MQKIIIYLTLILVFSFLGARNVVITMKDGKTIKGHLEKITVSEDDGSSETGFLIAQQGQSELRFPIKKIKEITFKSKDDISCFKDSRYAPTRKFCSMKSNFILKPVEKMSGPCIELIDDRKIEFHISGREKPVTAYFYTISRHNGGREKDVSYPELTKEVREISKKNIKKMYFKEKIEKVKKNKPEKKIEKGNKK